MLMSIDAALAGVEPRDVFNVLRQAISKLAKDQALHIRYYDGDILRDLPPYIERAKVKQATVPDSG